MEALPGLFLGLSTGTPGDEGEPIVLDGAGDGGPSSGGAGPSSAAGPSSGGNDPEDGDLVELSREQFHDAVAGRISPCVAPGLRLGTTVLDGKRMTGLFATRRFDKCTPIGVYTGTPILGSEFNRAKKIAKEYAYQLKTIDVEGTKLSFVIVPPYGADGKVDLRKHPLAALNEPPSRTVSNVVMQQMTIPLEQMRQEGRPSDVIEPLEMLVAYTTRKVEPGEQLFLHYGTSYQDFRTYSAGNPSSVQCSNEIDRLFPSGVPWSCVVQIPRKLLDEQDDSDEEWKPGRRHR